MPRPEQEDKGKTDNVSLPPAFFWRLGTLQLKDAMARQIQEQLGLQPGSLGAEETFGS